MSGHYPFLIRGPNNLNFETKQISKIHQYKIGDDNFIAYGLKTGEIFIAETSVKDEQPISIEFKLLLIPSFENSSGGVVALTVARMPFKIITDSNEFGLVSLHEDGKVRLWDLQDGKCVLCSRNGKFKNPSRIKKFGTLLNHKKRFLYAIEKCGNFYLIDIWNMKTHEVRFPTYVDYADSYKCDDGVVVVLDQDSKLEVYEFTGLLTDAFYNYNLYVNCPMEMLQIIKSHRKLQVQVGYLPLREHDSPTDESNYEFRRFKRPPVRIFEKEDLFVIFSKDRIISYPKEEHLIFGDMNDFEKMQKKRSNFKSVEIDFDTRDQVVDVVELPGGGFLLITKVNNPSFFDRESKAGEHCLYFNFKDIKFLMDIMENGENFEENVSVISENLKIDKMKNESKLYVRMKPSIIEFPGLKLQNEGLEKSIMFHNSHLILHNEDDNSINWVKMDNLPEPIFSYEAGDPKKIAFSKKQEIVRLDTTDGAFKTVFDANKCIFRAIYDSFNYEVKKDLRLSHISGVFQSFIEADEEISFTLTGSLKDRQLYYILSTSKGKIILIPLFINFHQKLLEIYYKDLQMDSISSLEIINGNLLCCSKFGELCIVNFNCKSEFSVCSQEIRANNYTLVLKTLRDQDIGVVELSAKVKKITPVVVTGESQNHKLTQDFFLDAIGLVLESNKVVILQISTKISLFEHRFNEKDVIGLFFDALHEFFFILYDDGEVEVFNVNLGNVIAMMNTRNQILSMADPENVDRGNKDLLFQLQFFINGCFSYERSLNLRSHPLNLNDLLEQYSNCYIDLKSYSKYCGSILMNLTVAGEIVEYNTQFYHNPLLSTHIELISFSDSLKMKRPHNLVDEEEASRSNLNSPKKKGRFGDDDLSKFTSLNDLSKAIEKSNEKKQRQESMDMDKVQETKKIHLMIQNLLERDRFALARERLGDKPIEMLNDYKEKGSFQIDQVSELINIISTLNYSGKQILIDCESQSCNQVLKVKINNRAMNVMLVSPPNYDPAHKDMKLILTCLVFPFGLDLQSDLEITKAFGSNQMILDITPGICGIGDSLSFRLNSHYVSFRELQDDPEAAIDKNKRKLLNLELYKISPFQSSNYMLGVVCEVIYLFKSGFTKVQALIDALKIVYFRRIPKVQGFKNFSFKILSMLALNDRLLIAAGAHFIINNIYSQVEDTKIFDIDPEAMEFCSHFFLTAQQKNQDTQSPSKVASSGSLNMISKFELFATSILLVELRKPESKLATTDDMASFSHSLIIKLISKSIEIKVCASYPFLVIPLIKICLEMLNHMKVRSQRKTFHLLIRNISYISLYYGLTFPASDKENLSLINSGFLMEEGLKNDKRLFVFLDRLKHQSYDVRRGIRVHIFKLVKLLGELDLEFLLKVLADMANSPEFTKLIALNTLDFLKYIIRFCETRFNKFLILWAEILMKCLNPNRPEIRKFCQKLATSSLKSLLKRFPEVAFHKKSQHFFIPNEQNEIVIFDLRTAMRWKKLNSHSTKVTCIGIEEKGNYLASYSHGDKNLKIWKIGSTGFFENLIRKSTEEYKNLKVPFDIPCGNHHPLIIKWAGKKKIQFSVPTKKWATPFKF